MRTLDVITALIQLAKDDLLASPSILGAVLTQYGVPFDQGVSNRWIRGDLGDPPIGLSFSFLEDPLFRRVIATGTLKRTEHSVSVRILWRNPDDADLKLTEDKETLGMFMSSLAFALGEVYETKKLAPSGGWPIPAGVAGSPEVREIDSDMRLEVRHDGCYATQVGFMCYSQR